MERPQLPLSDYWRRLLTCDELTDPAYPAVDLSQTITAVTCDSRSAVPGCLFLCKGAAFRPDYLTQALEKGAVAYVSEQPYDVAAPCIQVRNIRRAMGLLADQAWGHPSGHLKLVGLTGTKGKTTIAYFLKHILDRWRKAEGLHPVGLLSTIVTDDGVLSRPARLTTPEPLDLQRHLWNAVNAGCGYLVMEESSQALKYGRVRGVELAVALFSNFGEDHISPREHPTKEDYFQSKLKIFDQAKTAVINWDDPACPQILERAREKCGRVLTFSLGDRAADVCGWDAVRKGEGMTFKARWSEQESQLYIPMSGIFNVSNALAALAVCELLEVPVCHVVEGLAQARVPGRMETYHRDDRTVIVDYAHNGMSLAALLKAVRQDYPGLPVTVVFGCTGDKGWDRREGMAKAADQYADRIILTEDDAGSVPVAQVCEEIAAHIHAHSYETILDREKAVQTAIEGCPIPGVVVLAGKGSDDHQLRPNGLEPCVPDGLLARKYLGLPLEPEQNICPQV